jgi:hypothetical protein
VLFYFAPHEEISSKLFLPRFSVSSISIPTLDPQNSDNIHEEILLLQYQKFLGFLLPNNQKSNLYKNYRTIYDIEPKIIDEDRLSIYNKLKENKLQKDHHPYIEACLTAMGMSGLQNRTLKEEVARLEISLCRHANSLRRLVLRYFKSLLLIGFRIIIIFLAGIIINAVVDDPNHCNIISADKKYQCHWLALSFFLAISICTPLVLRAPMKWIHQLSSKLTNPVSSQWDHDISFFERFVFVFVVLELIADMIGIMALWNIPTNTGFIAAFVCLLTMLLCYVFGMISYLNLKPKK